MGNSCIGLGPASEGQYTPNHPPGERIVRPCALNSNCEALQSRALVQRAFLSNFNGEIPHEAVQVAEKVLFVIPSEARDLLFFSASKKQQIPRANTALRNDMVRVFPQGVEPALHTRAARALQ